MTGMTEPLTIIGTLASRMAFALAVPLQQRLKDRVVGPAEQRALEHACLDALDEAVRALAPDVDEADITHALSLFGEALAAGRALDLALAETSVAGDASSTWRRAFERLGYDVDTLPIELAAFIAELQQVLPETLRRHASAPGSPLFGIVVLSDLSRLGHDLDSIDARLGRGVAALIPLAAHLRSALDQARDACRVTDTPFYTPHLLLALIDAPDAIASDCLDARRPGLADDLRARLVRYVTTVEFESGFIAFHWTEREDIRAAQRLAANVGSPAVETGLLLAAVLETPSNTQQQLRELLGVEGLADVARCALEAVRATWDTTPGNVFEDPW
jgi:Clp amino terminal domain, pathogenicity island component